MRHLPAILATAAMLVAIQWTSLATVLLVPAAAVTGAMVLAARDVAHARFLRNHPYLKEATK